MPDLRPSSVASRCRRRWLFAGCVFDEANWILLVDGRGVAIETKPLELLRALLLRGGELVSKDELLDQIWPDVTVVEASLTTAVHKLRSALGDEQRDSHIIQTVPKIGYRIGVPIEVGECASAVAAPAPAQALTFAEARVRHVWQTPLVAALSVAMVIAALIVGPMQREAAANDRVFTQRDAANALRRLDVGAIEQLLAAGWNPNGPFDDQDNGALTFVLNRCEWDRGHDQEQMVLMVRTLVDGGARLDHRNTWGDTPYSIAKAVRYCGPNHPVTQSIREMCYAGYKPLGDRCLASYELQRQAG
jgi:DNA-binding winged helix-turn-helix (wHTH) protein